MPQAVDGCGINPINSAVETRVDGGDGLRVILVAPSEFPLSAADGPGSDADRRNSQVRLSERSFRHSSLLDEVHGLDCQAAGGRVSCSCFLSSIQRITAEKSSSRFPAA